MHKRWLSALGAGATVVVSSLLFANAAFAHGWVISPPSRQDHCAKGRTSFDCGQVKYEPQSVEAAKGAMTCHGGSAFTILNDHSRPWPVTSTGSGTVTFTWYCTACHVTRDWEYFLSNGTRVGYVSGGMRQPSQTTSHTVSGIPGGRQRILARWNIGDTAAAFYACIDLNVGGGGGSPTPTPTPTPRVRPRVTPTPTPTPRAGARPTPTPTPTPSGGGGGTWVAWTYYPVGATVTYGGLSYRCLQAHTSQPGWEPPYVPALWSRI